MPSGKKRKEEKNLHYHISLKSNCTLKFYEAKLAKDRIIDFYQRKLFFKSATSYILFSLTRELFYNKIKAIFSFALSLK